MRSRKVVIMSAKRTTSGRRICLRRARMEWFDIAMVVCIEYILIAQTFSPMG
jgi:hypothetical protein